MGRVCVAVIATLVAFSATGCAVVKQYAERDLYREPWCYPKIKYDRLKHKTEAGISCRF